MTRYETTNRINWFQLIADINRFGVPTIRIAELIFVPRETIMGWKNVGSEPRHHDGEGLIKLWLQITDKARGDLPRCIPPL